MRTSTRLSTTLMSAALLTTGLAGLAVAQDAGIGVGIEGTVDVHGSSTVAPISTAVSEDLKEATLDDGSLANPGFGYFVGEEGTGDGFSQFFCVDNSDISDASRAIREDEVALCAESGVDWVELKVAYDGLAVITSPENPLECMSFTDLYAVLGPEADDYDDPATEAPVDPINTWELAEKFAHELGSTTDFPEGDIAITAPGTESGTYDSFIELVLADIAEERGAEETTRDPVPPIYVGAANDRVIIDGVSRYPTSIGFVGLYYAQGAGDAVKILGIDDGDGDCVLPSAETVSDGSYPISRPLFIYPALNRLESNPAIAAWVDFYLSDDGITNAAEVGYVPLPSDELEATRAAWAEATGMAE